MERRPEDLPLLKLGSTNVEVAYLKYLIEKPTPTYLSNLMEEAKKPLVFDAELEEDVKYFQSTHLGQDGFFLSSDGIVGRNTWWALQNPSGSSQRSFIDAKVPNGLTSARNAILQRALEEYNKGVKEEPDNSNRGPIVDIYTGSRAVPWCMLFVSYVLRECNISTPWPAREGGTYNCWKKAKESFIGHAVSDSNYQPAPGDLFMIQYGNGKGHVGFVLRVEYKDGKLYRFNTIEGNAGNRVKIGMRYVSKEPNLVGFVNVANDKSSLNQNYEKGVVVESDTLDNRTR